MNNQEITIFPASYGNFGERVFQYKGEVYRATNDDHLFELVNNDIYTVAVGRKLVISATSIQLKLDGYKYVLKHKTLNPASYCLEWSRTMRLDCLRKIIELNRLLHQVGFITVDIHLFNFMLDKNQPIYIDVGGIQRYSENTKAAFINSFLTAFSWIKNDTVAKNSDLQNITICPRYKKPFHQLRVMRLKSLQSEQLFDKLMLQIDRIDTTKQTTEWSHYGDSRAIPETTEDFEAVKRHEDGKVNTVYNILDTMKPKAVIDFGCNDGYFSFLAADYFGVKVIACDIDEMSLQRGYRHAVKNDSDIYFLKMDVMKPIRATGIMDECPASWNRLKCEAGLAVSIIHHVMRYSQHGNFTFLRLGKILDAFIEKWLLIEFIYPDDSHLRNWKLPAYYNVENFIRSFMQFFSKYERYPSNEKTREFFLFTK